MVPPTGGSVLVAGGRLLNMTVRGALTGGEGTGKTGGQVG